MKRVKKPAMYVETGINFVWTGHGFGNALILAHLTKICNDNGINTVFSEHRKTRGLVDVPLYDPKLHENYFRHAWKGISSTSKHKNCDEPFIIQYVKNIENLTGKKIKLNQDHSYIPVTFHDSPDIPYIDVVMCTQTSPWAPYRDWPYFDELKQLFNANKISFIDLNLNKIFSNECLNYVKNAKLYLGLETGMSHYVSRFANGKALILQSGFCPFIHWTYPYDYECLKIDIDCERRPCFINRDDITKGVVCNNNVTCMKQISPEMVFSAVVKRLS